MAPLQSSSTSSTMPTFPADQLMHPPQTNFFPAPISGRFSIVAIIKSTIKKTALLPSFVAYDALQSMASGEATFVRLECFEHSTGHCSRFENLTNKLLIHSDEFCFLVTDNVSIDPTWLTTLTPLSSSPSETQRRNLVFLRKLGEGGYGQVFLAHDLARSTPSKPIFSAVKIQKPTSPSEVLEIRSEMLIQRKLSPHKNFVSLHRAFHESGYFVMVMDLMDGDLHNVALIGDMPRARHILTQLFDAVEHMHGNGIYHRDIKPNNILFTSLPSESTTESETESIHLTDFGFTTPNRISSPSNAGGTRTYQPPELLSARPTLNLTNDLWSLSITIFVLLLGTEPWSRASSKLPSSSSGSNSFKKWDYDYTEYLHNPQSLEDRFPISPAFATFLRKCLAPSPKDRLTLEQMRKELTSIDTFWLNIDELKELESRDPSSRALKYAMRVGLDRFPDSEASALAAEALLRSFGMVVDIDINIDSGDLTSSDGPIGPDTPDLLPIDTIPPDHDLKAGYKAGLTLLPSSSDLELLAL